MALLQRFYDPTAGSIAIGGVNLQAMDPETTRSVMGYVSQEAVLFEGTIRFNLTVSSFCSEHEHPHYITNELTRPFSLARPTRTR